MSEPSSGSDGPFPMPMDWAKAGHVIVKAAEAVGWEFDDLDKIAKRVQLIEFGLTAEAEFAAILSWLGRCPLVHRLDQDNFGSNRGRAWRIPDLYAVIEYSGHRVPLLIEVKTTKDEILKLPSDALQNMQAYASLHSAPLLIAWKPRRVGFWLLVEPAIARMQGSKSIIDLDSAMKNNLLSAVAGDFAIVPKEGVEIFFEFELEQVLRETQDGLHGVVKVTDAGVRDANGNLARNVSYAMSAILTSCMDEVDSRDGGKFRKAFVTHGGMVFAQQILRTAVAMRHQSTGATKWSYVARDLSTYLQVDTLREEIRKHFGSFVQYQFFQHPGTWPKSLPQAWNAITD